MVCSGFLHGFRPLNYEYTEPPSSEGRDLAKHFGCKFIETSAKQRINVDEAFSNLVREIRKYNKVRSFYTFSWTLSHLSNKPFRSSKLVGQYSRAAAATLLEYTAA